MKHLKTVLPVAAVLLNVAFCALAQAQDMPPPPGGERPALAEMIATGLVTQMEMQGPDGKPLVCYVLTDSAGNTVMLPGKHMGPPPGSEQVTAVNVEDYAGKNVTIAGKGFQMELDGKTMKHIVVITKIDLTAIVAAQ